MCLFSPLGLVEYSQDSMPNRNAPTISWPMAVFTCICEALAWLVYIFDVSLLGPETFSP